MDNSQANSGQDFLDKDIFELLGLTHLSAEEKKKLTKTITDTVEGRVWDRLFDQLTKEGKIEGYKTALDAGDEKLGQFLSSNNIDLNQMFTEEAMALRMQLTSAADLFDQGVTLTKKAD